MWQQSANHSLSLCEHKRLHLASSKQNYYVISCMSNNKSNFHSYTFRHTKLAWKNGENTLFDEVTLVVKYECDRMRPAPTRIIEWCLCNTAAATASWTSVYLDGFLERTASGNGLVETEAGATRADGKRQSARCSRETQGKLKRILRDFRRLSPWRSGEERGT